MEMGLQTSELLGSEVFDCLDQKFYLCSHVGYCLLCLHYLYLHLGFCHLGEAEWRQLHCYECGRWELWHVVLQGSRLRGVICLEDTYTAGVGTCVERVFYCEGNLSKSMGTPPWKLEQSWQGNPQIYYMADRGVQIWQENPQRIL